jgi:rod shape determining protein RodA
MVLGVLPVVGVPLPFFSYGGSSLLTCLVGAGLLMNISMRRYVF